jgi:hypothetical protein
LLGWALPLSTRSLEPDNRKLLIEKRDRYQRRSEEVIERGATEGVLNVIDVKLSSYAILGMCNHVSLWNRPTGAHTIDDIAAAYGARAADGRRCRCW